MSTLGPRVTLQPTVEFKFDEQGNITGVALDFFDAVTGAEVMLPAEVLEMERHDPALEGHMNKIDAWLRQTFTAPFLGVTTHPDNVIRKEDQE
jgi:hypothetical protein